MEITHYRDYRTYLRDELERRVSGNPQYSLRAFARDLDITPQMLSFVLSRKKSISADVAANIAQLLGLDPEESSYFLDLVMLSHSRTTSMKKLIEYRLQERTPESGKYKSLEVEAFKAISDWHHFAILELSLTQGFKSDPTWIASRLGISVFEATQAIDRLKRLELLDEDTRGKLKRTELNLTAIYGSPNSALRKLAKQLLQKAADSLESQSVTERDITNITMAIDPSLLPEAKQMIAKFRRDLCKFLEQGRRTEVYTFAPALFRITKDKKEYKS